MTKTAHSSPPAGRLRHNLHDVHGVDLVYHVALHGCARRVAGDGVSEGLTHKVSRDVLAKIVDSDLGVAGGGTRLRGGDGVGDAVTGRQDAVRPSVGASSL